MGRLTSLTILQGWGVVGSWGHTVPTRVVLRLFVYVTFHSSPYVTLNEWAQRPALCRPQHTPHPGLSKNKSEGNSPPRPPMHRRGHAPNQGTLSPRCLFSFKNFSAVRTGLFCSHRN